MKARILCPLLILALAGCGSSSPAPELSRLRLEAARAVLLVGDRDPLTTVGVFSDGHEEDYTHLSSYTVSNPHASSFDEDTVSLLALAPGPVIVTARYLDFQVQASILVERFP